MQSLNFFGSPQILSSTTLYTQEYTNGLNNWLKYAQGRQLFEQLNEQKSTGLSREDQRILLQFVATTEIFFELSGNEKIEHFNTMINAGFLVEDLIDYVINGVGRMGYSLLARIEDPNLFDWLVENGGRFVHPEESMLGFVIESTKDNWRHKEDCKKWLKILPKFLMKASSVDFSQLELHKLSHLISLAKSDPEIADILFSKGMKHIKEHPQEALKIANLLLGGQSNKRDLEDFFYLVSKRVFREDILLQILKETEIVYKQLSNIDFFKTWSIYWNLPDLLLELNKRTGNLQASVYFYALLQTSNLKDAAKLLSEIHELENPLEELDNVLKKEVVSHIEELQQKEKNTIWHQLGKHYLISESWPLLEKLGLDPNWEHPVTRETILFTNNVSTFFHESSNNYCRVNFNHLDLNGNNALEFYCLKVKINSYCRGLTIRVLTQNNLTITDRLPCAKKCRETFTDPFKQALLAACLLNPKLTGKLLDCSDETGEEIILAIQKDPELVAVLGSEIKSNPVNVDCGSFSFERDAWKEKFTPEGQNILKEYIETDSIFDSKRLGLIDFSSKWKSIIPVEALGLVPESAYVSLALSTLKIQQETLPVEPLTLNEMLYGFNHDDIRLFNAYLFEQPEVMGFFLKEFFKVKEMNLRAGGENLTTYGTVVYRLSEKLRDLFQLQKNEWELPQQQKKLIEAFKERVAPTFKETLEIDGQAECQVFGRIVVVKSKGIDQVYKFMDKKESYRRFSQELTVSEAFRDLGNFFNLKSQWINPLGVYLIKRLPSQFSQFKLTVEPAIAFHYEDAHFQYLNKTSILDEKQMEGDRIGRERALHDAAKQIKLGVYPNLAKLLRKDNHHIVCVNLLAELIKSRSTRSPKLGTRMIEEVFEMIRDPNIRAWHGLTNLRDVKLYYSWWEPEDSVRHSNRDLREMPSNENTETRFFLQMNALASVLVIDMLILAERSLDDRKMNWKDQGFLKEFAEELIMGYAYVSSAYSDKPLDKTLFFAKNCGINWILAAKQIAFWLDTSFNGYPSWVEKKQLPPGLYEENIKITIDPSKAANFDPVKGFTTNGNQDLGMKEGPWGLDEFEKAMYTLFNAIILAEPKETKKMFSRYYDDCFLDY